MNMKDLQRRVDRMIMADAQNQIMFRDIKKMWDMEWQLPPNLAALDWVRKEVSSDAHDAVRAGTRVLATLTPKVNIAPLAPNRQSREAMDRIERALTWHFENAVRRNGSAMYDIVRYSMLYDKVAAQVVYLPNQESSLGKVASGARKKAIMRFGPFAIIVRDPKDVFVDMSDWMAERVVHRYSMSANELMDFWGEENTGAIKKRVAQTTDDGAKLFYTVFDYQDYDARKVYVVEQADELAIAKPIAANAITIVDKKTELPFMPWVVRTGGRQLIPMLYSLFKTKQWESQNIYETIMSSEVIAYAAAPRGIITSATPELRETEYGDPARDKAIMPGEKYERLRPPEIDQNFQTLSDRLQTRIAKSTVPNVLQTGDFPSGTAFATLNLATQSGVKAMSPYKRLAEEAIADIFAHMLYWIDYSKDTLEAYPINEQNAQQTTDYITIAPGDFDVEHLYIKVELTPDVPTDRMSRINAAVMSNQNLMYSNRRALEDIGVTQPGAEIDMWYEEQQRKTDFEVEQQQKMMAMQMQMQMQMQAAQMQMQQAMMQGQQQPGTPAEAARNPQIQQQYARQRGRGFEATQGSSGFNPAIGGNPPAMANPGGTRESQQVNNISSAGGGGEGF